MLEAFLMAGGIALAATGAVALVLAIIVWWMRRPHWW